MMNGSFTDSYSVLNSGGWVVLCGALGAYPMDFQRLHLRLKAQCSGTGIQLGNDILVF